MSSDDSMQLMRNGKPVSPYESDLVLKIWRRLNYLIKQKWITVTLTEEP